MPTTTPFANLITFSRGSNATVVGPNGLVQWAPNNLMTFSEQFDASAWIKTTATVTANSTTAPDGTNTADTLTPTSADSNVRQEALPGAVAPHTFSIWLRSATGANISTTLRAWRVSPFQAVTSAAITVTPTWQRFTLTFTPLDATAHAVVVGASSTLSTGQNLFAWGAQLELGTAATTYNPTTVKNLLGFSEAFDNAAWTKTDASIVTGAAANPVNGLFNAQKLMENTANAVHLLGQAATLTATPYVFSIYAKAAERSWVQLRNASGTNQLAYFNLASGVAGTVGANATASITAVGGGWYRCAIAFTAAAGSNTMHVRTATGDNVNSYTGDGNSGIYIYGAQLSDSASLDPYVPTPGAAPSSTAYYGPRFDYDPVTLQPRGILIEEQRTNLLLRSEEFDNAAWAKINATVTANSATSPDGTVDADLLVASTSLSQHRLDFATTSTAATHAFSVYAKVGGYNFVYLRLGLNGGFVDLSSGAVSGVTGGYTMTATSVGNGWYRVVLVGAAALNETARINVCQTTTSDFTGNGTSGIYLWGAQLEAGAFATSYIPTIASTATRSADVATISGALFSQWYGLSEGTFAYEYQRLPGLAGGLGGRIFASGVGGSNSYGIWVNTATGTQDALTIRDISGDAVASALFSINTSAANKGAVAYRVNDFAWSSNSGAATTDTSGAVPSLSDQLRFGRAINTDASFVNGWLRNIRYIPVRAADFQLQALTT